MNRIDLPEEPGAIDHQGGEPLAGSGFEAEEPDDRFGPDVPKAEVA